MSNENRAVMECYLLLENITYIIRFDSICQIDSLTKSVRLFSKIVFNKHFANFFSLFFANLKIIISIINIEIWEKHEKKRYNTILSISQIVFNKKYI